MVSKTSEKTEAIQLRRQGLSYREILEKVPVAKSSLSLWLRSVGLSRSQKQRLTLKKLASAKRGAMVRKTQRLALTQKITEEAKPEVGTITPRELWLIGTALYWAEGAKSKEHSPSTLVIFSNSDPRMIRVFLTWCENTLKIPRAQVSFSIYIHQNYSGKLSSVRKFWSSMTGYPVARFGKIYFKRHSVHSNRKNMGSSYHGLLRVTIGKSVNLNRKIAAWTEEVSRQCGVV